MSEHKPHPGSKAVGDVVLPASSLAEIASDAPYQSHRIVPHTLFDSPSARVVHIALDEGQVLTEHMAPFPIIVQVVEGSVVFVVNGQENLLEAGGLIHLEARLLHEVRAVGSARIQITLLKQHKG
ncbi:AraC family ligand binding domain-containing protein [Populibacterium corticicola]|uniref:AraC family ligand binding domain-containing protein n=1 Tax=Populibacterium corticicola TaxID=1812826 RepID=A0ABW5XCY7_9MICO